MLVDCPEAVPPWNVLVGTAIRDPELMRATPLLVVKTVGREIAVNLLLASRAFTKTPKLSPKKSVGTQPGLQKDCHLQT